MTYDTSISRRQNFERQAAARVNVPDHIEHESGYIAAAVGRQMKNWKIGNERRWREAHADAQRIQDWLLSQGEFAGSWEGDFYKPHPLARNPNARGGFADLIEKLAEDLRDCGGLSDKQTEIVRNAIARQAQFAAERNAKMAALRAEEAATSNWVGEVGKRQDFELEIRWVKGFEGMYGTSYVHGLRDAAGNSIIYKGTNKLGEKGEQVKVKATIKEHGERDGVKQTIIARPKLA